MINPNLLDIEFTIESACDITEDNMNNIVHGVASFVGEHIHELDNDLVLQEFFKYCDERNYPMEIAGQVSAQIIKGIYGDDMLDKMNNQGYIGEKPTIH